MELPKVTNSSTEQFVLVSKKYKSFSILCNPSVCGTTLFLRKRETLLERWGGRLLSMLFSLNGIGKGVWLVARHDHCMSQHSNFLLIVKVLE
jgi:hypothetical protein